MPEEDNLESLLRKLENELGQVQEQLALTRNRGARPGEPLRRSTLRLGAVQPPIPPESSAPPVRRNTGVQAAVRAPRAQNTDSFESQAPESQPPESKSPESKSPESKSPESKSPASAGRYVIVGEPPRRRRAP